MNISTEKFNLIKEQLEKYINENNGEFPSCNVLKQKEEKLFKLIRSNGGFKYWQVNFGLERSKIVKEVKLKSVGDQLQKFIDEYNRFPTRKLDNENHSSLLTLLNKHGGFTYWRKRTGFESPRLIRDEKILENTLLEYLKNKDDFPTGDSLQKNNPSLYGSIKLNGGILKWRDKMGFNNRLNRWRKQYKTNDKDKLKEIENSFIAFAKDCQNKKLTFKLLEEYNFDLSRLIKNNGGFNKWIKTININQTKTTKDEKIIEYELREHISKLGYFPSTDYISEHYPCLLYSIRATGGIIKWRKKLDSPLLYRPNGFWDIYENLENEIKNSFPNMIAKNIFPTTVMIKINLTEEFYMH